VHSLPRSAPSLVVERVRSRTSLRERARYAAFIIDRPFECGGVMSGIRIYEAYKGWIYEVWFQGRVVVIGCHATLEAAQLAAATA
jgi:hypothetical protein